MTDFEEERTFLDRTCFVMVDLINTHPLVAEDTMLWAPRESALEMQYEWTSSQRKGRKRTETIVVVR